MTPNGGSSDPATTVKASRQLTMECFDQLPPVLRNRLSEAPFNISSIGALAVFRKDGIAVALQVIDRVESALRKSEAA